MSGALRPPPGKWVCVGGHFGMVAGPSGHFSYQSPIGYNRAGAAEDTLQFVEQSAFGPRYAVWFPGATAAQTARNAALIHWTVS